MERAHNILSNTSLSKYFWNEIVNTIYYLVNCYPSMAIELKTLDDAGFDTLANSSNMNIFYCLDYFQVNESMLESRARKGMFI